MAQDLQTGRVFYYYFYVFYVLLKDVGLLSQERSVEELMCASACVYMDGQCSGASRSRAKRKAWGWFGLWFKIIKRKKKKSPTILQMLHVGQSVHAVSTLRLRGGDTIWIRGGCAVALLAERL